MFSFSEKNDGKRYTPEKNRMRIDILKQTARDGGSLRDAFLNLRKAGVGMSSTTVSKDYRIARVIKTSGSPEAERKAYGYYDTVVRKTLKKGERIEKGYERIAKIKQKSKDKLDDMERDAYDAALRYSLEESPKV